MSERLEARRVRVRARSAARPSTTGRLVDVRIERFRHADGEEVTREIVRHHGRGGILAYDERATCGSCASRARRSASPTCWRSRRGGSTWRARSRCRPPSASSPRRSGAARDRWEPILSYYTGAGFTDERVHLFARHRAVTRRAPTASENERIEIVRWPLAELDDAIAECRDAKTLIAPDVAARGA